MGLPAFYGIIQSYSLEMANPSLFKSGRAEKGDLCG
jgi:hypothetical protein